MMNAARMIVSVVLAASLCGCDEAPAPQPDVVATATATASAGASRPIGRTDKPEIAIKILEGDIANAERALLAEPKSVRRMGALVAARMQEASMLGRIGALDEVVRLGELAVETAPKDGQAWLVRARSRAAVHRFGEALSDLDKADALGARSDLRMATRSSLLLATGKYDEALAIARQMREQRETMRTIAWVGYVLGRMGKLDEANEAFKAAEAKFRGTSAFETAWLYFEWGSMLDRNGDEDGAADKYRDAVKRLPQYAHAVGHLVSALSPAEAIAMLEPVTKSSDDPEYKGTLGYFMNKDKPGSGDALLEQATKAYDTLMEKHGLAFADHAGWFYLDVVKKPDRAVEVAEMNLDNRKVPEAYELMIAALVATGDGDAACEMADEALRFKYPSRGSKRFAAEAYDGCGKKDRAAELRAEVGDVGRGKH